MRYVDSSHDPSEIDERVGVLQLNDGAPIEVMNGPPALRVLLGLLGLVGR